MSQETGQRNGGAAQDTPNGNHSGAFSTLKGDNTPVPGHNDPKERIHTIKAKVKKKEEKLVHKDQTPEGGFDSTPIPQGSPGYTVRITFHRATNLPFADFNSLSSDPFVLVQLNTGLPTRHVEDPPLRFRTPTIHRSLDPTWECSWVVANIPARGFKMKARVYDEDPADHDDILGNVHLHVDRINESWGGIKNEGFRIRKRMGSKRAYLMRGIAVMLSRAKHMNGQLYMTIEVLGRTEGEGGRAYTVGPQYWFQHFSPLIGRLAGTKEPGKQGKAERYNFQSNEIQLRGPVPAVLYHRYVEFKPFIKGMFSKAGLRGRVLNHALHHQHARVYNFDRHTLSGNFISPSKDLTLQFLDMVHYDQGGRIFTYVLTLDGHFRFTETGKEFGIDLLSKHTMHSDVSVYVAFSGEFFVRRLEHPRKSLESRDQRTHPPDDLPNGPPNDASPHDVETYQLVIDNDSGTYRPNGAHLPDLKRFLASNLPGLKIQAMRCDDERLGHMKQEQKERRHAEGNDRTFVQASSVSSSISSSDIEELNENQGARAASVESEGVHKPPLVMQGERKAHAPENRVKQWIQGDREREERETEDDMAAVRAESARNNRSTIEAR
ncbi:MAG: hypothetical protein M1837_006803 [Sclerophora amabilis]|nr:MAG: hypothetical protein M1837_006803 [Sclerophora amabilis]